VGFGALGRLSYMPTVTQSRPQRSAEVSAIVCDHQASLLRTARRHSLCADDAQDACQRGVEIFLRRAGRLRMDTAVNWLHTVVKHEAMAIRGARQRLVSGVEPALDRHEGRCAPGVEERVESREQVAQGAAVLSELKPQERMALLLQAEGHSYSDISRRMGWTYTKVNRCLTEGRRSFLERYAAIEAGGDAQRTPGAGASVTARR